MTDLNWPPLFVKVPNKAELELYILHVFLGIQTCPVLWNPEMIKNYYIIRLLYIIESWKEHSFEKKKFILDSKFKNSRHLTNLRLTFFSGSQSVCKWQSESDIKMFWICHKSATISFSAKGQTHWHFFGTKCPPKWHPIKGYCAFQKHMNSLFEAVNHNKLLRSQATNLEPQKHTKQIKMHQ